MGDSVLKKPRLGLMVRADNSGLGAQTFEFWKFLKPEKTMIVNIQELNGLMPLPDRYPGATMVGWPTNEEIDEFLKDIDVVMAFETPYNYYIFEKARELGIKSILYFNYEFLDYLKQPLLPKPDLLIEGTLWNFEKVAECQFAKTIYLPMPVNREKLPFRKKKKARMFLHIAGHKTFMDRNGTDIVMAAIPFVKNQEVRFTIRTQQDVNSFEYDPRVIVVGNEVMDYWDLYMDEDVFLLPRKYAGTSLPMNEALSCGMIPIMTDMDPQNTFLKDESLIKPVNIQKIMTRVEIDCAEITPKQLAERIDAFAEMDEDQIGELSEHSDMIASMWDWEVVGPKYQEAITELFNGTE